MADEFAMGHSMPRSSADVLRVVLELIAAREARVATRLVVLSRAVREWIDPILHHTITLSRASSTRALLRSIHQSTKPPSFYAAHVKNISISQEAHTEHLAEVLLVCTGITCLTFWSIPSQSYYPRTASLSPDNGIISAAPRPTATPQGPRLFLPQEPTAPGDIKHLTFTDNCFDAICPRRLAASFRSDSHYHNSPDFSRPVFSYVTHLSVFNKSEEWASWNLGWYLPFLTHLALGLNNSPNSNPIAHDTDTTKNSNSIPPSGARTAQDGSSAKIRSLRMANMIKDVLHKSRVLCTIVIVIEFDPAPTTTMDMLTNAILELEHEDSKIFPFNNPPTVPDPRLVFAQNTNPFVVRHAHGENEERMWMAARRRVGEQKKWGRGPEILVL